MSLSRSIKNLKTDKRLQSLNAKMGEVTQEQHQAYLQTLEDVSEKSKKLVVDGTDDGDDVDSDDLDVN